jgi:hypothetical protein
MERDEFRLTSSVPNAALHGTAGSSLHSHTLTMSPTSTSSSTSTTIATDVTFSSLTCIVCDALPCPLDDETSTFADVSELEYEVPSVSVLAPALKGRLKVEGPLGEPEEGRVGC